MTFSIKTIEGDDLMSSEFDTHQEALWHLCNSPEFAKVGKTRAERETVLYIDNHESWVNEVVPCPLCNKNAGWHDEEKDLVMCPHCKKTSLI